jgi:hypothetical protein
LFPAPSPAYSIVSADYPEWTIYATLILFISLYQTNSTYGAVMNQTIQYLKEFLNTLAGKVTAILAFALLVIVVLGLFGASILPVFHPLIYIAVIFAMLIFAFQVTLKEMSKRRAEKTSQPPVQLEEPSEQSDQDESQKDQPTPSPVSLEEAKRSYLDAVIEDSRVLRLSGLDEGAGDPSSVRLSLEDVYVSMNTRTTIDKIVEREGRTLLVEKRLSAAEVISKSPQRRIVLLGLPGTGKSTFVRYLALRMAQEISGESRRLEHWNGSAVLPIVISLGRFAETLPKDLSKGTAEMLEKFLYTTWKFDFRRARFFSKYLLRALRKDGGLVMFDGLDEVGSLSLRPVVVQAVEAFSIKYAHNPNTRFLVTCRTYSYQDKRWQLTDWPVHELALLDDEQIRQFVNAWYDQHVQLDPAKKLEYNEKRGKLLDALRHGDRRRLWEVAPYPIILTMMAIIHASYELPDSRAQVYMQCVELLLEKWQTKRSIMGHEQYRSILAELGIPAARLYQALYEIAFEAHRSREAKDDKDGDGSLVTERLVAGILQEHLQNEEKLRIFLEYCQSANGLLMLQGTVTPARAEPGTPPRRVYTFPHLTFEEYLAGRHLETEGADCARQLLDAAFDRWSEVIKLLGEYLCFERNDRDRMNGLLEALSPPLPEKPQEKDWRAVSLAGELLLLYKRAISKPTPHENVIVQNLRELVMTGALSPRERADAADTLDHLWQPNDLHAFIAINSPQGCFQLLNTR